MEHCNILKIELESRPKISARVKKRSFEGVFLNWRGFLDASAGTVMLRAGSLGVPDMQTGIVPGVGQEQ